MPLILLVEDNQSLADVIVRDLKGHGFQVTHAAGGMEALKKLAETPFDAMILDWMLPDLDGLEVMRRMQDAKVNVPVLMLTARAEEIDRVIGLEVGADDYLTKPFSMRELVACLHALLRRVEKDRQMFTPGAKETQGSLRWGAISIEPEHHCVLLDGNPVDLTPIEFGLLRLFVANPNRIFNRPYLMETVWEQDYIPGDRSVDNAVQRLRKKIHPHGDAIEAVWGVGYRLRDPL